MKCMLVTQSCPTLCNMDCSSPGSSVHGIPQARMLEWVAILFSRDLPNPGIKPSSPALQVDYLPAEQLGKPQLSGRSLIASFVWLGKIRCNKGK